jgi:hypothetical protein
MFKYIITEKFVYLEWTRLSGYIQMMSIIITSKSMASLMKTISFCDLDFEAKIFIINTLPLTYYLFYLRIL